MTTPSYHPVEPRDFEALKTTPLPGLEIVSVKSEGAEEAIWLHALSTEPRPRPASVVRHPIHGVSVILQVYSDPAVLSLLANHWQCTLVSDQGDERVEPGAPILRGAWYVDPSNLCLVPPV